MTEPRLTVLESRRVLRIARGGRLQPWLGPALRGLAGGLLKARVCRQPVADQFDDSKWKYCKGCPLRAGCAYGETVEGAPPGAGAEDAPRPFVIAPAFPVAEVGVVGGTIPVRALFVGPTAAAHVAAFWDALRLGGATPHLGLGYRHVHFDVLPSLPDRTEDVELPLDPATVAGIVPRVRVEFTSPLILETREGPGDRWLVEKPTLQQLLRPWQGLAELWRYGGAALPDESVNRAWELATGVPTLRSRLELYDQTKSSERTKQRWDARGVVGWAEYGPVPAGLLPWLTWAGRLHVGTHRVAGAGGWTVTELG